MIWIVKKEAEILEEEREVSNSKMKAWERGSV